MGLFCDVWEIFSCQNHHFLNFTNNYSTSKNRKIKLLKLTAFIHCARVEGVWTEAFGEQRICDIKST